MNNTRKIIFLIFSLTCALQLYLNPHWISELKAQGNYEEQKRVVNEILQSVSTNDSTSEVATVISDICVDGANNVIELTGTLQEDCNNLVGSTPGEPAEAGSALGQITLDQGRAPLAANNTSVGAQLANLAIRLSALRAGSTGIGLGGLAFNVDGHTISSEDALRLVNGLLGENGGAASADSIGDFGRLGVFVTGTYADGDRNETSREAGFDFDSWAITAGADYRLTDRFVLGGAINYVDVDTDVKRKSGDLDLDGWGVAIYATYYQSDRFYLDGILGYGRNDFDQSRDIGYTLSGRTVNQTLKADYDGNIFSASFGGGYDFNLGGFTLAPEGRLRYTYADVDSYREKTSNPGVAGSGWRLSVDDQDYTAFTMSLGGRASYAWSLPWGVLLPLARFEWFHEFNDGNSDVDAQFIDDTSGALISLPVDDDDKNYFNLGLGVSAVFAKGRSAYIYYQKLLDHDELDLDAVNLGVRLEF